MPAKNKRRSPAGLELIWRTLTQAVDDVHAAQGSSESLDARVNSYAGTAPHKDAHVIRIEFNVAMNAKGAGAPAGTGVPLRIVPSKSDFNAAATSIKLTVSYEPWCTVNVIV